MSKYRHQAVHEQLKQAKAKLEALETTYKCKLALELAELENLEQKQDDNIIISTLQNCSGEAVPTIPNQQEHMLFSSANNVWSVGRMKAD